MDLAAALSKAKGNLKQSETRVTLRDGRQFVERRDETGQSSVEFVGKTETPAYLREEEKGYSSLKPAHFSATSSSWIRAEPGKQPSSSSGGDAGALTRLRVVSFNVWFADKNFDVRAQLLFSMLQRLSPDIICLQEVTPRLIKLLIDQAWLRESYWMSDCTGVTVSPYGVLMLSRLPVRNLALHLIPTEMGRRALVADLDIPSPGSPTSLRVATVHLESLTGASYRAFREAQLKTIFPLFGDCRHGLLMGDFNFDPSQPEQAHLDPSFTDAWCKVHGDDPGYTFREYPNRIDRMMFKSPCLSPTSMDLLGKEANADGVYPSDHLGLCCDFSVTH